MHHAVPVHVTDGEEELVDNVTALLLRELHHPGQVVEQLTTAGPAHGHKGFALRMAL